MDTLETPLTLAADTKRSLPTGIYQVTLLGPPSAANIQPRVLETRFNVAAQQGNVLTVPPSFVGRYTFSFVFTGTNVHRVIVLDSGLAGGHVDDDYRMDSGTGAAKNTLITDLSLDAQGVLHGIIRFTRRTDKMASVDERFELRYANNQYSIVGGGWEIQPSSVEMVKLVQKNSDTFKNYKPNVEPPTPRLVTKDER